MQYPLVEKIGDPDLLTGRAEEFRKFHRWISRMPRRISKSWALLGRRKSGKTSFVQRLFNELWSANGPVIPFYISIPDAPIWYPDLAEQYYRTFASQYISFLSRNPLPVEQPLTLEQIQAYAEAENIEVLRNDAQIMLDYRAAEKYGLLWETAYRAPHRTAAVYDQRILVIIDEFQYLSAHVYPDPNFATKPIEALPGSFHQVSESKIAPMLATGSYVGWMTDIMHKYLEAGRLSHVNFSPYLSESEGLEAVYRYAEALDEPITNETAVQINELCMADPFFISCVLESSCPVRDLSSAEGVVETVNYEMADRGSELSGTWQEYIDRTLDRINDKYGKQMLLHLSRYNDRYWTPRELQKELGLDEKETTLHRKLVSMVMGDLIEWGSSDIRFRGLTDGTLNLILRHRFEEEIAEHQAPPDLRIDFREKIADLQRENRSLRGRLSQVVGIMAEIQLANAFRSRKRFQLGDFFQGVNNHEQLNLIDVRTRVLIQRQDGKNMELDIVAEADDGQVLLVEVRKRKAKSGVRDVEDFQEKIAVWQVEHPEHTLLAGFLSLGGFTDEACRFCEQQGIAWSEEMRYF